MRTSRTILFSLHEQSSTAIMPAPVVLPVNSKLNQTVIDELDDLFDFIPPEKLSRKLRNIFLAYIRHESEMLPSDINDTITEMMLLLDFLDTSSDQIGITNNSA